ncbi:amidohydrolase family protein [Parasphingopyxis algicola]|uniref:amidohydrolase family protein n=1 Tax=Parasphingopyxis algicola TaxID=2026624 RepID=UPI0015A3E7B1|nr:amidohydrolase family protein [Parasphingopyxis algicola]QLC26215.1 amidohydrolase family protein [Parasphingopyxis algicola]
MKALSSFLVSLSVVTSTSAPAIEPPPTLQFDNGQWLGGEGFETGTVYSTAGRLTSVRPPRIDDRIDLGGGYVIPPLCEAHNHNLGGDEDEREIIDRYLEAGIYYVGILSNFPRYTGMALRNFNRPDSVDVQFANGGITAPGAHPIPLRERLLGFGAYPDFTRESLADHAYFAVGTAEDLDRIWPIALSYRPDFIKIFIMQSEAHDAPPEDTEYEGARGLHPELAGALVERAHDHGLRIFAHVETAADFALAVDLGVDVVAHLPGRRSPEMIAPEAAHRAAERGVAVHTTAVLADRLRERDPEGYAAVRNAQIANLRLLREAGVMLAIGSDLYGSDSRAEVEYLRELNIFSPLELLEMWTANCARTVFPNRRIGALSEGHETSVLVLDGNPLENWSAIGEINLRVKDGHILELQESRSMGE